MRPNTKATRVLSFITGIAFIAIAQLADMFTWQGQAPSDGIGQIKLYALITGALLLLHGFRLVDLVFAVGVPLIPLLFFLKDNFGIWGLEISVNFGETQIIVLLLCTYLLFSRHRFVPQTYYPWFIFWCAVAGIVFSLHVAEFIYHARTLMESHLTTKFEEGFFLWQAKMLFTNELYAAIDTYPYVLMNYPPLFHLTARLVDLTQNDLLYSGRLIQFMSTLFVSLFILLTVHRLTAIRYPQIPRLCGALLGASLFYNFEPVYRWSTSMRIDGLATALSVLGVYLYIISTRRPKPLYASGLVFVMALYTKPTVIAGATACLIVSFVVRPRPTIRVAAIMGAIGLSIFGVLTVLTGAEFYNHLIPYNIHQMGLDHLLSVYRQGILRYAFDYVLVLAYIAMIYIRWNKAHSGSNGRPSFVQHIRQDAEAQSSVLIITYFFIALLVSLTAARLGSDTYYFRELSAA